MDSFYLNFSSGFLSFKCIWCARIYKYRCNYSIFFNWKQCKTDKNFQTSETAIIWYQGGIDDFPRKMKRSAFTEIYVLKKKYTMRTIYSLVGYEILWMGSMEFSFLPNNILINFIFGATLPVVGGWGPVQILWIGYDSFTSQQDPLKVHNLVAYAKFGLKLTWSDDHNDFHITR